MKDKGKKGYFKDIRTYKIINNFLKKTARYKFGKMKV